jgi:formylglycine-generating enzyme required for sulfatase activity
VTRDLWFSIMDKEGPGIGIKKVEGGTTISLNVFGGGTSRSKCKADKCPVVGPDWYDAVRFCNKLSELEGLEPAYEIIERHPEPGVSWNRNANGYRLPTEAEFEYAARAGTQQTYAGSDDIWEVADAGNKAVAVGQNKPNAWGLHGMTGNVWEWTWDWFGPYSGGTAVDPAGPARGRAHQEITGQVKPMRVTRGGSVTIIPAPKGVRARWVTVWRRQTEFPYCEWTVKTGLRLVRNL